MNILSIFVWQLWHISSSFMEMLPREIIFTKTKDRNRKIIIIELKIVCTWCIQTYVHTHTHTHAETANACMLLVRIFVSFSLSKLKASVEISQPSTNRCIVFPLSLLFRGYTILCVVCTYNVHIVYILDSHIILYFFFFVSALDSVSEHILYGIRYILLHSHTVKRWNGWNSLHLSRSSYFFSCLFHFFVHQTVCVPCPLTRWTKKKKKYDIFVFGFYSANTNLWLSELYVVSMIICPKCEYTRNRKRTRQRANCIVHFRKSIVVNEFPYLSSHMLG